METANNSDLMTYRGLAALVGKAEGTLRHWVMRGQIPYLKIGAHVRFSKTEIQKWLAAKVRQAQPEQGRGKAAGELPFPAGGTDGR